MLHEYGSEFRIIRNLQPQKTLISGAFINQNSSIMRTLDSIIQEFESEKNGVITHRRPFLNLKENSSHTKWYARGYSA